MSIPALGVKLRLSCVPAVSIPNVPICPPVQNSPYSTHPVPPSPFCLSWIILISLNWCVLIPEVVCVTSTINLLPAEADVLIPYTDLAAPTAVVVVIPVIVTRSPIDVEPNPTWPPVCIPVQLLISREIKSIT